MEEQNPFAARNYYQLHITPANSAGTRPATPIVRLALLRSPSTGYDCARGDEMKIGDDFKLNNGVQMPAFGLGTYLIGSGGDAVQVVLWALEAGYRLVDTATLYGNEREVGQAVKRSGLPREEVFVTTKLWNTDHGYDKAISACRASMRELGVEYLDLYLVHWPVPGLRGESWRAMETLLGEGLCRAVGVSNYTVEHLDELLTSARVVPAVNQVEFHPLLYQQELLEYCRDRGILLQAYSPLARTRGFTGKVVREIAARYAKTPPQVYLRWALRHGVAVIPKSSNRERIRENAGAFGFELSDEDMVALDSLGGGVHVSWDPAGEP
jgi:diketogulonate reductase-like aldo/keto reductase